MAYNEFHNLESIGVDGKTEKLVQYGYKPGNGRLKSITYANGDTMKATYNNLGQMVAEKWFDQDGILTAHYKYTYDGQGNIVRSIDMLAQKEYNYEYDDGRIVRATEASIAFSGEMVVSKTLVNSIRYFYDAEGTMTRKVIAPVGGETQTVYYETTDDNTVVKLNAGGKTVTSHSKTDSFGRKVFDELQLGTGFVSRQFQYHAGMATQEHEDNGKLKSTPTTQLVSRITFADDRTLDYEYDAEERITKVTDSVDGVTEYTYDALGQLLTETVNDTLVNVMTYDDYGNILTKNSVAYTYSEGAWKDLLVSYNGQTITYDAQGNPTSYLGHTLAWEKGRQLKSFDGNTYTYNANGIRTSKTIAGVKHNYILDGTKILREEWCGNILTPIYDNEDSVCGIIYNGVPYYFQKNLQGDVIAITNENGGVISRYSYDAWGVPSIVKGDSACSIATINPFRYRSYYFDQEIEMYYLQSRYYDPQIARFINADTPVICAFSCSTNAFCYCQLDPINSSDHMGMIGTAAAAASFIGTYGAGLSGWALTVKLSSFLLAVAPYLLAALAVVAAAVLVYSVAVSYSNNCTKTLADVKIKKQQGKPYRLAYISKWGGLIKVGKNLSFVEALAALGVSGAVNSVTKRYTYDLSRSSNAQRQLEHYGQWGIYANSQYAAKALAVVFGFSAKPEVHGSGMYGHYHGGYYNAKLKKYEHVFHIWFGGILHY